MTVSRIINSPHEPEDSRTTAMHTEKNEYYRLRKTLSRIAPTLHLVTRRPFRTNPLPTAPPQPLLPPAFGSPRQSSEIHIRGLIVSSYSSDHSHWNSFQSLGGWLKKHGIPALYGLDTRGLTKRIREHGAVLGKIEMPGQVRWRVSGGEILGMSERGTQPGDGESRHMANQDIALVRVNFFTVALPVAVRQGPSGDFHSDQSSCRSLPNSFFVPLHFYYFYIV